MSNLQLNWYNASSFPPSESTPNLNWNHHPSPGPDPFQSLANLGPLHNAPSSSCIGASSANRNHRAQASRGNPGQGPSGGRSNDFSQVAGYQGEHMSQTNPKTSAYCQTTLRQSSSNLLSAQPPPNCPIPPAPHDSHAAQAFTESSSHPSVALRIILDDVLHSKWLHNQDREPRMTDDYSKRIYRQVSHLSGCPAFDFSSSKTSLLTVFVGSLGGRPSCLICGKSKDSIPRALSCARSHLQLKPFRCGGCQACNEENGYAAFWSAALLRDHLSGQRMVTCPECDKRLRQGNLRRHRATQHKDIEELISFLLDGDESD